MKKVALVVLLASGLMAADSGVYVGVDAGNTAVDGKVSWSAGSETLSENGTSATAKIGTYFNENNRAYVSIQHASIREAKLLSAGAGYDYLIGNSAIKPFAGVLAGYATLKPADGDSATGLYYGAQAGLNYAVNQNISLEAGYRYMKANIKDTFTDFDGENIVKFDTVKNWFIGANYKF